MQPKSIARSSVLRASARLPNWALGADLVTLINILFTFLGLGFSPLALASDMGNGPMMVLTWLLGFAAAVVFSILKSSERDELGALRKLDSVKFFKTLLLLLPLIFTLGLVALAVS